MTSTVTAVSLALLVLFIVVVRLTENNDRRHPTWWQRWQWKRERLRFNPRMRIR